MGMFMHQKSKKVLKCLVAAWVVCLGVSGVYAADPAPLVYKIEPQPVSTALKEFAAQSNMQLIFTEEDVGSARTNGVSGRRAPREALSEILRGTGLKFQFTANNVVVVKNPSREAKSDPPGEGDHGTNEKEGKPDTSREFRVAPVDQTAAGSSAVGNVNQNGGPALTEIIVTAQKRSERLQDVPASLTALSAASLQTQGVTDFADYMTLVPSLADFSGGSEGHGAVILRGLNTGYYQFSNTVGYYIDDVPFSATSALSYGAFLTMDPDLTDIDHLEVLKGPQATLYGASTLGGLIKVVTKQPDLNSDGGEIRLDGSTTDGGGSGYGLVGIANVVLIPGELAMRVSGFDRDTPGYMRNVELGTKDEDVSHKQGGRITVKWVPIDDLEIKFSAFLQTLKTDGWNYEDINLQTLAPLTGPYTYAAHYDPSFDTSYEVYNATVDYKVGSIGTLTSSTSYANYRDHEIEDYSLQYGPYYFSVAPVPVPANAALAADFRVDLNKFSEELRFSSERLGAFEWIVGLFYTREQTGFPDNSNITIPPSLAPIPGPDASSVTINAPSNYKEEAGFADLTYYFNDTLDLTVGGRYSQNQQKTTYCLGGYAEIAGCTYNSSSDSDFTYLAALSWQPTTDIHTYARIATSYRPGGPQQEPVAGYPTSFKHDSLINYEVGLKAGWLDNRLRTNLALYDMDWKNVQLTSNIAGFSVISNAGEATVRGVELETQIVPVERLTVGINVAYTDAKLDSVSAGVTTATGAVAGDSLPFTPSWSASAVVDYVQPLNGILTSSYGATFRYQGSKWSDYPGDLYNTGVVIPHYDTLDIRTGLDWSRYQLQARIANLFNSHGLDTIVDQRIEGNPPAWAAIIRPRTLTLSLAVKF